ncbi:MAG: hypothetical protein AABW79_00335 [Nanoarchaeota archaeon]
MITERQVLEQILGARKYVRENAEALRQQYGSHYLAISGNAVVDHDADEGELIKRTLGSNRGVTYGTIDHLTGLPELVTAAEERLKELAVA